MKKIVALGIVVIMALSFTGCGESVTLTDEQNDLIAEYIAGTMLKYSYENEWKYTKLAIAQNTYVNKGTSASTENTTPAAKPSGTAGNGTGTTGVGSTGGSQSSASDNPLTSMPSSLGLSNVSIKYKGVSVGSSYPTDQLAISVPALTGYKVAAVEFTITNNSGSAITMNTESSSVTMKMTIDGNSVSQTTTMLKNDINNLEDITLNGGESYTVAAVFQVEESISSHVSGSTLTVNAGSTTLGTLKIE